MLDLLIMSSIGLFGIGSWMCKGNDNAQRRKRAAAAGEMYYYTNDSKIRAVDTNELCILRRDNPSFCYRTTVVRMKHPIWNPLRDFTQEKADELNKKLEEAGKGYYYKASYWKSIKERKSIWIPVEKGTDRPFKIHYDKYKWGFYHKRYFTITYYEDIENGEFNSHVIEDINNHRNDWHRELMVDELDKYTEIGATYDVDSDCIFFNVFARDRCFN